MGERRRRWMWTMCLEGGDKAPEVRWGGIYGDRLEWGMHLELHWDLCGIFAAS